MSESEYGIEHGKSTWENGRGLFRGLPSEGASACLRRRGKRWKEA
jgi:hypothetical protein